MRYEDIIEWLHRLWFKVETTPAVRQFVHHFSWVFAGVVISKVFILLINIIGGRVLGPAEFGRYNVIYSIGLLMVFPLLMGTNTALVKFLAPQHERRKILPYFGASLFIFMVSSIVFILLYLVLIAIRPDLMTDRLLYYLAIIFAVALGLYYFSEGLLQGLGSLKRLSVYEALVALVSLVAFLVLLRPLNSFFAFYLSAMLGFVLFAALTFMRHRQLLQEVKVSMRMTREVLHYGVFAMLVALAATVLGNTDKILIYRFLGETKVGIYQAYSMGSLILISILTNIFIMVFFPTAARYPDKRPILKRLDRLILPAGVLISLGIPFAQFIMLKFFGPQYFINPWLMVAFAVASAIYFANLAYLWLMSSTGVQGIKTASITLIVAAVVNILLCYYLIPRKDLFGVILSLIISSLIPLIYLRLRLPGELERHFEEDARETG